MRQRRTGFTLIELLVVIAIIAILASILFPVFSRAREKARQASCASNLKQITMAMMMYTDDYDEILPVYSHGYGIQGSMGFDGGDGVRWADMLMPYVRNGQLFDCKSAGAQKKIGRAHV